MIETLKPLIPVPVRNKIRQALLLKRELPPYLTWKWRLRNDPLFNLENVDQGLRPRPASTTRTSAQRLEVADRIIAAYRLASAHQANKSDVYKVSNAWVPIYRKPLQPLLAALEKGDAIGLRDLLDNFFRSSISTGLIGLATDMAGTFFGSPPPSRFRRTQLLIDQLYRYRLLGRLVPGVSASDLHVEDFGNPYGMFVDGEFVRSGTDYQYYYAKRIAQLLPHFPEHAFVAELGGGIGGFGYFLCRSRPAGLTYINLDLPEILCISTYQLLNLFPNKKAVLFGEINAITSEALSEFDLALMPSFVIEQLAENSVHASFNSYSLSEMDLPTVQNYVRQLSRVSTKAILHVNHVRELARADDFPFDGNKFMLKERTRAEWNIGRHLKCDEYEFLYERR